MWKSGGSVAQLKTPLTLDEQVALLQSRGLVIDDLKSAKEILAKTNYYRLINAYSLGLYDTSSDIEPKTKYQPGISLNQLFDIYQFDAKLRHIVFELIEHFELTFRTALAYYLAHKYCATAYLRPEIYYDYGLYQSFLGDLKREKVVQQRALIVQHHNATYRGTLPVWAMVEVTSFGTISKLYKNLNGRAQRDIASIYHTYSDLLTSWLNAYVSVRNVCAHYGRLYNANLLSRPKIPKNGPPLNNYKIFSVIYLLFKQVDDNLLKLSLYLRLSAAIATHTYVEPSKIGFPSNWVELLRENIGLPKEDMDLLP